MKKKLLLIVAVVLFLAAGAVMLYRYFKPVEASNDVILPVQATTKMTFTDSVSSLKETPGDYLLYLFEENTDSNYVTNSLLAPILSNQDVSIPMITYIDTTTNKDLTVTQLKSAFGIERTPAFVYLTVTSDHKITINSTLTYVSEKPFSQDTFKQWLFDNKLWTGPFSVR